MSEIFDEDEVQDPQPPRSRSRGLVVTATVLYLLGLVVHFA